ncbi:unnamed protein product [Orchesella dallaii]|uniref:Aminoacyl-transfer RNA synthetases class-II family profile domain-containing protein n=1 Tax=Orchesella dallaii TaxID=48710 RepID=A0ABP1RLK7_9HEXA
MNETQSDLIVKIFNYLSDNIYNQLDTLKLGEIFDKPHHEIINWLQVLEKEQELFKLVERAKIQLEFTKEGNQILENGSLEVIAYEAVPPGEAGIGLNILKKLVSPSVRKSGMSKAIKNGWLKVVPESCNVVRLVQEVEDEIRIQLKIVKSGGILDDFSLFELKKRKLLIQKTEKYFLIHRGKDCSKEICDSLRSRIFPISSGYLHPLLKMRSELRSILLEMGFSELPSISYLIDPDPNQIGAKMLQEIYSKGKIFHPTKLFVINRKVHFQTEKVKATRIRNTIVESHQVELLLADYDLSLGNLIAIIKELLRKLGIVKICFKPCYNPEMKPSLKAVSLYKASKKYEEVGTGGIFRPDLLSVLKASENLRVMRWGFSMENVFAIQNGMLMKNINKLIGNRVDLQTMYNNNNSKISNRNGNILC